MSFDDSVPPPQGAVRSPIVAWLLPAAFVVPVLGYAWELRDASHYQFAWLYVPAVLAFLPSRLREATDRRPGTTAGTWCWWGPAIVSALLGAATATPWLGAIGAMFYGAGAAYTAGGRPALRAVAPAWFCLWLAIRPPFDLDLHLIHALQGVAAATASRMLDACGQIHVLSGHIITVPGKRLLIAEACSGIQSLFAGWACAWLLCLLLKRSPLRWALLTVAVPVWAVAANALRIVVIAVLWNQYRISADEGWIHEALGMGVFGVLLAMIVSTDLMLGWFFRVEGDRPLLVLPTTLIGPPAPTATSAKSVAPAAGSDVWFGRPAVIGGAVVLAVQLTFVVAGDRLLGDGKSRAAPPPFGAEALPRQIGAWRQTGFEEIARNNTHGEGTASRVWRFESPHGKASASLDWPFAGWHELSVCYAAEGWDFRRRSVTPVPAVCTAGTTVLTSADYFRGTDGVEGRLWFELFDVEGRAIYESGDPLDVRARIIRRLTRWQDRVWGATPTLQLQVFLEHAQTGPTDEAEASARAIAGRHLFDAVRAALVPQCTGRVPVAEAAP